MPIYLVDRSLPGITMNQLVLMQKSAIETSQRFTKEGKSVRYIRSMFVPREAHCMCVFEAANSAFVKEVNEAANLPFNSIVEALDLTPK
jgi:hypothetical protein